MKAMKTMKLRDYREPAMKVVKLSHQCHILAGSGEQQSGAQREDYQSQEW